MRRREQVLRVVHVEALPVRVVEEPADPPDDARQVQDDEPDDLDAQPAHPRRGLQRDLADRPRVDRDEQVEADLGREAPRLVDPVEEPGRVVDLEQTEVGEDVARAVQPALGEPEREVDDQHREPVAGKDAQDAAPPESVRRRRLPAGEVGRRERPVEQEPRDQEEDRDAGVAVGEQLPEAAVGAVPGLEPGVVQEDGAGGDGPEPVEAREVGVAPGGGLMGVGRVIGRDARLLRDHRGHATGQGSPEFRSAVPGVPLSGVLLLLVVLLLDVHRPDVVVRRRRCSRPRASPCTSSGPGCCTCACRCGRRDTRSGVLAVEPLAQRRRRCAL